ncbi:hypothetical protein BD289DRAFT_480838 [Coniella lustricola]|uniref:Uncharacterized protein n=1 Tax=Coniella lustricola TaxID=2025994 RepID=A0A2T3AEE4_9PEZI|nr:hypothetical protein BD289DRAFT_480838 [Coniella lustricola]
MKAGYLLTSLAWTSWATATPLVRTAVLVAGSATKTISLEAASRNGGSGQQPPHELGAVDSHPPATAEQQPSVILDSEHPLTTVELMSLSAAVASSVHIPTLVSLQQSPVKPKPFKTKVSVGALVAPSNANGQTQQVAQVLEIGIVKTYLVPIYFASTQRIDTLVAAAILTFLLVVLAYEIYHLALRFGIFVFGEEEAGDFQPRKYDASLMTMENGTSTYEMYSDDEDATMAPFGGFELPREHKRPRPSENLYEKSLPI